MDVDRPELGSGIVVVEPRAVGQHEHERRQLRLVVELVEPVGLVAVVVGRAVVGRQFGVGLGSLVAFDDSGIPGWRGCFGPVRSLRTSGIVGARFDQIQYVGIDQTGSLAKDH